MKPEKEVNRPAGSGNTQDGESPPDAASPQPLEQASSKPPDPFDPARFAASSAVQGQVGVVKELAICQVRKPNKQEFVRVHPGADYQLRTHVLVLEAERETYLVEPAVAAALPGETRMVTLRLAVSRDGSVFLWPVNEPSVDGKENSWNLSARVGAIKAETKWVRLISNGGQKAYDVFVAQDVDDTPAWPDKSLRDILVVAFGDGFVIRDLSHPVIKRLLGRK